MKRRSRGIAFAVGRSAFGVAGAEAVAGQVVERGAGPAQRLDHVELVGPSPVVELLVFLLEIIGQLDRQQELDADARVAEELVVQQRPDQGAHLAGVALDLLGLVDPVDQHDDAGVTQRVEHALELAQQLVAFLGPPRVGGRQRLAAELGRLEPEQLPAQGGGVAAEHASVPCECRGRIPLGTGQPPAPVDPAGEDRDQQPGEDAPGRGGRENRDQSSDDQRRAEADLEVAAGPERPEARSAAEPAPAPAIGSPVEAS